MKTASLLLLVGICSSLNLAHADPKYWLYQKLLKKNALLQSEGNEGAGVIAGAPTKTITGNFDQVIDHFAKTARARSASKKSGATFKQRYFVDSTYAKDATSPVIYYLCGEGTCEGPTDTQEVNQIAKKYHAYRVALEHRYYGYSQPFATLDSANMKYKRLKI